MKKYISVISLESDKIESLSKFITNANFDLKASEIKTDIVQFITDYIKTIYLSDDPILDSSLKIKIENLLNIKYFTEIRPLEITNLIDNFVQNSEKAKASEISFLFKKISNNKLLIRISDDGNGILPENVDKIFDFGYTTTNGSGIGLYHIKLTVQRMKGRIKASSKENLGTVFEVEL
jgi:signal transduction histidine kinase